MEVNYMNQSAHTNMQWRPIIKEFYPQSRITASFTRLPAPLSIMLPKFKQSRCLLSISVGQTTQEGEKLAAILDLVNASFDSCVLMICDTAQRHTMALDGTEDADFFYDLALKEGDLWLEYHEKYYSRLTIPTEIVRWNTLLEHPKYYEQERKIKEFLNRDPSYKAAFDETVDEFVRKYTERLPCRAFVEPERVRQLSFDFILEDCVGLCLWSEFECQFKVYPGKFAAPMEETYKHFVNPSFPHLLQTASIRLRHSSLPKPQHFSLLQNTDIKFMRDIAL
jgi:hypothetical protein